MKQFILDEAGHTRLDTFLTKIGQVLNNVARRASFATYAMGLLGDGRRKSMEPIAAKHCPDILAVDAQHQRVQHFITDSPWNDRSVRRESAKYGLSVLTKREPVTHWIIDDTGFLKQGKHSVGVKRQYTGSAGKVANCQVGVSLSIATPTAHLPIDFELYLPRDWAEDDIRRKEARIPDDIKFQTKLQLALTMIEQAIADGVPLGMILVDCAYGASTQFRRGIRKNGLTYGVAIKSDMKVWQVDKLDRRRGGRTLTVSEFANRIVERGGFRRTTTWRSGTHGKLSSRFAAQRVLPICDEGRSRAEREIVWLLIEWEDGEDAPNKFYFITAPPHVTKKWLVRQVKQRWRTERAYQDMKGQLGLDHFEGRRYPGWHHHVSVVLSCYAFTVAEHARHFPPASREAH